MRATFFGERVMTLSGVFEEFDEVRGYITMGWYTIEYSYGQVLIQRDLDEY